MLTGMLSSSVPGALESVHGASECVHRLQEVGNYQAR